MGGRVLKRVALISVPYHSGVVESAGTWLNLGFVYIAGALRKAGFEVDYYDAMALWHNYDQIRARIEDFRPDVVATSAFTAAAVEATRLCSLVKSLDPGIVTVVGNVHATFCYQEMLTESPGLFDFVVRGEGEATLPRLLHCLNAGGDPAKVAGIAFVRDGRVEVTPPAPFIQDLDALTPAWDLVEWPIYTYRAKENSRLAIVSSARGCRENCSFCSQKLFWERGWRARSAENFVAELEMLNQRFGVNVAMLADEIPTLDRARWEKILHLMIQRKPGVKLLMETRVNDILRDADLMETYREAGVEHIYVGVEAGSQAMLDLFRKGTRVEDSKKAIDLINGADIVSETSFVLGMPEDTPESMAAMVELAKYYDPDMAFFLAIAPWPYAELYPHLEPHVATRDYSRYNLVKPVVKPVAMTLEEVERELGLASMRFFMHKFQNLEKLSPWKQQFMLAVFEILVRHSYLAGDMRRMVHAGGAAMPEAVKDLMRRMHAHGHSQPVAPIP